MARLGRFKVVLPGTISFGTLLTFYLTPLHAKFQTEHDREENLPRVAIIGSGIGGSSAAHFVRKILGSNAHIQVFESSDRVGGRLATIDVAGSTYEAGGTIIHPRNMYMKAFAKDLGLGTLTTVDGIFALYDGKGVVFQTSSWPWLTAAKLFWRYGFSLFKMRRVTNDLLQKFSNIYTLQEQGKSFESVPAMFRAMGGDDFYNLTQKSLKTYLQEKGLSQFLIDELVTAVMRINYGQSTGLNAFAGCVSLAGAEPGLWSVEGGNWKVCDGLLKKSNSVVSKNTRIIEIIKKTDLSLNVKPLYYLRSSESLISTPFDVVILAMPLEISKNFIGCDGCKKWPYQKDLGKFQQTVATFQKAKLNTKNFNSVKIKTVGTMEMREICFSSVGAQRSVWKKGQDKVDSPVWKVFSREPLTNECKEKIFSEFEDSNEVIWLAYPHYTPPEKFLSFILDDGIFYVNAIEWAPSAMEMSALSGRNAALLTARYFHKKTVTNSDRKQVHDEL